MNDEIEGVRYWYDTDKTKPLPGQHRLHKNGKLATKEEADKDRKLKQNWQFIGLTNGTPTFKTIKTPVRKPDVVPYVPDELVDIWDKISERKSEGASGRAKPNRLSSDRPRKVIVDGIKVEVPRFYDNVSYQGRTSVRPLSGQHPTDVWAGKHSAIVADGDTKDKPRLQRYLGIQDRQGRRLRSFRSESYDSKMGTIAGTLVNFTK